jgi:membrane protease YdiL (CAAX protease family)
MNKLTRITIFIASYLLINYLFSENFIDNNFLLSMILIITINLSYIFLLKKFYIEKYNVYLDYTGYGSVWKSFFHGFIIFVIFDITSSLLFMLFKYESVLNLETYNTQINLVLDFILSILIIFIQLIFLELLSRSVIFEELKNKGVKVITSAILVSLIYMTFFIMPSSPVFTISTFFVSLVATYCYSEKGLVSSITFTFLTLIFSLPL